MSVRLVRRAFLAHLGLATGGLALGLFEPEAGAESLPTARPVDAGPPPGGGLHPSLFVHVAPDGLVRLTCHRSEMGQGVRSTLPVLLADELGADMARVRIVQADGDRAYGDQNTDGSRSIRMDFERLRRVAAVARTMLVTAAARRWKVKPEACVARGHAVHHEPSKRSLAFGDLVADAAKLAVPDAKAVTLRPDGEMRLRATTLPLVDAPGIVTGRAVFGADVVLPGMLTAVIARPPVVGGRASKHDATRALAVPGVKKVLELPVPKPPFGFQPLGGIAVVAADTWSALKGRAALDVTWESGPNASYSSGPYRDALTATVKAPGRVVREVGDVDAAFAGAARTVEAIYRTPHLPHATMEPPVAVAKVDGDRCEVWAPTQNPQAARTAVAKALGLDEGRVVVHVTLLGGGFGRKSKPDFVVEAALVARAAGAPVRLQWTRDDDLRHDYYHSTSAQRLAAAIDGAGAITAWHHRTAYPPIPSTFKDTASSEAGELQQGVLDVPLAIPNVRAENGAARAHTRIGWLRAVANVYHAFAVQSFLDELAHARGKDPRDHLLEVIGPARIVGLQELGVGELPNYGQPLDQHPIDTGRLRHVIERVTEVAGWSRRKAEGRALGLAAHRSFLAYVAVVVEAARVDGGRVVVPRAWIVADAGIVVNLERVRSQLEGAVLFALGHAMFGEITMHQGATVQGSLRDLRLMRIAEAPREVHVEVMTSDRPPSGVGEPGVPPVAPALANAVFALTGTRVRDLPIARAVPM